MSTEQSVLASMRTPRPVDLSSFDGYVYDHSAECFRDSDGKAIQGEEILRSFYDQHIGTVDKIRGRIFKWKLTSVGKASASIEPATEVLKWLLRIVCGRILKSDEMMRGLLEPYRPEDMKLLKTESIDVFGYRASKNVIATFCAILLLIFLLTRIVGRTPGWLTTAAGNTFLGFAACILSIAFLDHVVPNVLLWLINRAVVARMKLTTMDFQLK